MPFPIAGAQTVSALRLTNNGSAGGSEGRLEVQIGDQVHSFWLLLAICQLLAIMVMVRTGGTRL